MSEQKRPSGVTPAPKAVTPVQQVKIGGAQHVGDHAMTEGRSPSEPTNRSLVQGCQWPLARPFCRSLCIACGATPPLSRTRQAQ